MERKIECTKQYRYEVLNDNSEAKTVLYVLHGYGQLAKFFIRKFQALNKNLLIVAPEGMHRFYLKGSSGRVGASWMTKEAREDDIADNIQWLDALDSDISKKYPIENRLVLGFSQGGATAVRWKAMGHTSFDEMILWACVFPPDLEIDRELSSGRQNDTHPYFAIGDQDEFYSDEQQNDLLQFYTDLGYKTLHYKGRHDIHIETLDQILRQMEVKIK